MPIMPGIESIASPKIQRVDQWWQDKRAGRKLPDRADLDPADLKPLLPYILLLEASLDPFRLRFRLLGTKVVYVSGFDFTGRYLDELLPPDTEEPWLDHYRRAFDSCAPVFGTTTVPTLHGALFDYEFAIFPLTHGGATVAQFLSIEDYGDSEPRVDQLIDDLAPWKKQRGEE